MQLCQERERERENERERERGQFDRRKRVKEKKMGGQRGKEEKNWRYIGEKKRIGYTKDKTTDGGWMDC